MKKISAIICLIFALIMVLTLPVGAAAPYQTYTYSIEGTALYSPDAYTPDDAIDSAYMGLTDKNVIRSIYPNLSDADIKAKAVAISNPSDLEVDVAQNVYIADTDNNRIVVLDRYYKLKFIIDTFINAQGIQDKLTAPAGVFITSKTVNGQKVPDRIFVCDTNANRIVTFDPNGNFLEVIPAPQSELFEEGDTYRPVALAVDPYDRLYVVSSTTYQGIIVMTDKGEFTSFIGAQKVTVSAWDKIWKRFQTEDQRALTESNVSTEFNNITLIDEFIYVTTQSIEESEVLSAIQSKSKSGTYAPVKMLNAAGTEIMSRNGFYPPSGEVDNKKSQPSDTIYGASTIVDVATGPEKTWSIIDQKRSKVFTYDDQGNLLFAFGDTGDQLGNISSNGLAAVTYQGDKMLLLDKSKSSFTVYRRTEYGDILIQALSNQNNRRFDRAIDDWQSILQRNSNFDAAYIGIGNAYYRSGEYEAAIQNFQAAYDTENYSIAYQEIRKEWISQYIILIPIIVVAICIGWSKFMGYATKVNKRVATSGKKRTYAQELLYVFHTMFHPFDGYWDLKHEKRGSVRAAVTILGMTIVALYYQAIGQGYILNPRQQYSDFFTVVLSIVIPLVLWVAGNWCLTTLFDGEGNLKDIFIASCYSLMPMVLIFIPTTIMSNVVLSTEAGILSVLNVVAFIWVGLLIFFGMMVTHDYTIGKNVLTVGGTIVAMVCIMFIAILFTTLLGKMVSFVTNIVTEIQFRL